MVATWTVDIHQRNNASALITGLPIGEWMFNYVLNAPGAFEAQMYIEEDIATEANLKPLAHEIRVKRNGTLVWGGDLWSVAVDTKSKFLTLRGEGYFARFRKRIVRDELIYTDVNVQTIMWNLINHAQGFTDGDHGVSQGAHTGGNRTVDQAFCAHEYPNIASGIDDLALMDDGCDWVITPTIGIAANKSFRTFQPRKGSDVSGSVELNPDNLINLTYEYDGTDLSNWITYIGPGDCNPPDVLVEDETSQNDFGLLEAAVESDEFDGLGDLRSHAREYLRNYKNPRYQAEATYYEDSGPAWGDFVLGDIVSVVSDQGYASFTRDMRVIGVEAEMNKDTVNFFRVTLDTVID